MSSIVGDHDSYHLVENASSCHQRDLTGYAYDKVMCDRGPAAKALVIKVAGRIVFLGLKEVVYSSFNLDLTSQGFSPHLISTEATNSDGSPPSSRWDAT